MAAPTLDDARRAAREIIDAGVGTVLVFGSLARADAQSGSDIDLVAIYDDLGDYSERARRRCDLEARAKAAAGCPVDVLVTDMPEWSIRTTKVPCSLEARIAVDALALAEVARHGEIDWDKEIGLPANPTAELQRRFDDFVGAVSDLAMFLAPTDREHRAAAAGDWPTLAAREDRRFAHACSAAHMIFEAGAKITCIVTTGAAPRRSHSIPELLAGQPDEVRQAFEEFSASIELAELDQWRQGAFYTEARPVASFDDAYLRRHATAATKIATFVADQCHDEGLDADTFTGLEDELRYCVDALDAPLRIARRGRCT